VKYLIEHGADYFIENHARETPMMNASSKPHIQQFFRDYLILSYSTNSNNLPKTSILKEIEERQEPMIDCIWEYKSFSETTWYPFSVAESGVLRKSLILKPDQTFKLDVHLKVRAGVYKVSVIQFLRHGKDFDPKRNLAWVRCRGSSLLNFDCYSIWQIMFVKHPLAIDSSPSLKTFYIPNIHQSTFKIQINSWYSCDA
jgi:hypothetical protein